MTYDLTKARHLEPLNDMKRIQSIWQKMVDMPRINQQKYWATDPVAGEIFLVTDLEPGHVLEYIQGTADDSVSTLYRYAPEFATRQSIIELRKALITEIGVVLMDLPSTVTIYDEGRGRNAHLRELGTAQLIDTLASLTGVSLNKDAIIVQP